MYKTIYFLQIPDGRIDDKFPPGVQKGRQVAERASGHDHRLALAHQLHVNIAACPGISVYKVNGVKIPKSHILLVSPAPRHIVGKYK